MNVQTAVLLVNIAAAATMLLVAALRPSHRRASLLAAAMALFAVGILSLASFGILVIAGGLCCTVAGLREQSHRTRRSNG
ncbi:MAG: hypothetical protein OXF61_09650 [Acidimicrobiaceae bacterium]|nr:hypothetical protein [Acidimicrobiaceae bacterium]